MAVRARRRQPARIQCGRALPTGLPVVGASFRAGPWCEHPRHHLRLFHLCSWRRVPPTWFGERCRAQASAGASRALVEHQRSLPDILPASAAAAEVAPAPGSRRGTENQRTGVDDRTSVPPRLWPATRQQTIARPTISWRCPTGLPALERSQLQNRLHDPLSIGVVNRHWVGSAERPQSRALIMAGAQGSWYSMRGVGFKSRLGLAP